MHRTTRLALAFALVLSTVASAPARSAPAPELRVELDRFNRSYEDPLPGILPVERAGLHVALSSPHQVLVLQHHLLVLTPLGDGTHHADLTLDFMGKGDLIADVTVGKLSKRMETEVLVPPQSHQLAARVRIRRDAGSYIVTPLELPPTLVSTIESPLGNRMIDWCQNMALVPFMAIDCDGLEQALTRAAVPLPPAGQELVVPAEQLTEEERRAIDDYLTTGAAQ